MIREGCRALVVAHPDDESLWFGGLLIRCPGDWTVICCSIPRADPIRAYKFFAACEVLGARGALLPFTEPLPSRPFDTLDSLGDLSRFDCIVTHGEVGEYGHPHHLAVHRHIADRWRERMVVGCYGAEPGALRVELTAEEWRRKCAALACYDHVSPMDGTLRKGEALVARYGAQFDLRVETYAA